MIKILRNFFEGVQEGRVKYIVILLISFFIIIELVFFEIYLKINLFDEIVSFDKENCTRIETDVNNIVKGVEDINLINIDEFKSRAMNVQRIFGINNKLLEIHLSYSKGGISGKIYKMDGNITVSIGRDYATLVCNLLLLQLIPLMVFVLFLFIFLLLHMMFY